MNKTLICFSFDDGRIDNYTIAYPILKKYGLSATFNITTGYINGDIGKGGLTYANPMTWEMVEEICKDPNMEIAGHGYWHRNTKEDIIEGTNGLLLRLKNYNLKEVKGFASPGTGLSLNYYNSIKDYLRNSGIEYVRLSLHYASFPKLKTLLRKISRVVSLPILYQWAYRDTMMKEVRNGIIYSVPVLSSISLSQLKSLINYATRTTSACILMFHSIVENGDIKDNWDFEKDKFENLCEYLSKERNREKLDVVTTWQAYKQLKTE